MRAHGRLSILLGTLGALSGVAAAATNEPFAALVAAALALGAGLSGRKNSASGTTTALAKSQADSLRATELSEELGMARLREQAMRQRIELLEHATRAAASSAAAMVPGPLSQSGPTNTRAGQHLLTDALTGLFSEAYFEVALEARLAAARRRLRPVALVLLDIVAGRPSEITVSPNADLVSTALRRTLREADTACRLDDGRYALVLEDTPEHGAIWTIERVRTHLAESGTAHTVWAGVACYPAHAFDKDEILSQAEHALRQARAWAQDRIEIATAD